MATERRVIIIGAHFTSSMTQGAQDNANAWLRDGWTLSDIQHGPQATVITFWKEKPEEK